MYEIDEYVVYKGSGVCKIVNIGTLDFGEMKKDKKFYFLCPVHAKASITYAPVESAKVPMRKVITREDAQQILEDISSIDIIQELNDKQVEMRYREIFKDCDCRRYMSIIKTIYIKGRERLVEGKKITSTDEKYNRMAEDLLYNEFSMALNLERSIVENIVMSRLELL